MPFLKHVFGFHHDLLLFIVPSALLLKLLVRREQLFVLPLQRMQSILTLLPCSPFLPTALCVLVEGLDALSLIHISEPTRLLSISYAVFCLKKKKENLNIQVRDNIIVMR
eukprot:TRINITY_DN28982_c0_g1_i3.p1 TRINITY_DN28982_c0_g1~~TRINITY_DN28982_c0_g1_i3.p1  ORF type:complete len:110 (+),score=15.78 TRINITY_DN28982_c0_g1_i3:110-439(+)